MNKLVVVSLAIVSVFGGGCVLGATLECIYGGDDGSKYANHSLYGNVLITLGTGENHTEISVTKREDDESVVAECHYSFPLSSLEKETIQFNDGSNFLIRDLFNLQVNQKLSTVPAYSTKGSVLLPVDTPTTTTPDKPKNSYSFKSCALFTGAGLGGFALYKLFTNPNVSSTVSSFVTQPEVIGGVTAGAVAGLTAKYGFKKSNIQACLTGLGAAGGVMGIGLLANNRFSGSKVTEINMLALGKVVPTNHS